MKTHKVIWAATAAIAVGGIALAPAIASARVPDPNSSFGARVHPGHITLSCTPGQRYGPLAPGQHVSVAITARGPHMSGNSDAAQSFLVTWPGTGSVVLDAAHPGRPMPAGATFPCVKKVLFTWQPKAGPNGTGGNTGVAKHRAIPANSVAPS